MLWKRVGMEGWTGGGERNDSLIEGQLERLDKGVGLVSFVG